MSVLHDPRLTAYDSGVYAELALWVAAGNVVKVGTREMPAPWDSNERRLWRRRRVASTHAAGMLPVGFYLGCAPGTSRMSSG
jgi:hypothetical protein